MCGVGSLRTPSWRQRFSLSVWEHLPLVYNCQKALVLEALRTRKEVPSMNLEDREMFVACFPNRSWLYCDVDWLQMANRSNISAGINNGLWIALTSSRLWHLVRIDPQWSNKSTLGVLNVGIPITTILFFYIVYCTLKDSFLGTCSTSLPSEDFLDYLLHTALSRIILSGVSYPAAIFIYYKERLNARSFCTTDTTF